MKLINKIALVCLLGTFALITGCDKTKPYDITVATPEAHFTGPERRTYSVVADPAPSFTLQVGTTDVSSSDRIVTYNVTSPSGAVAGTDYTIAGTNTLTIPANGAIADIVIQAVASQYASGKKDTLIFTLAQPSLAVADFQDTVTLIIAGPSGCAEDNLTSLNAVLGDYTNTNETLDGGPYGPYTTSISAVTITSPTTGTIVVENIWDNGWGPITFELDWTDPANRTTMVVPQDAIPGSDAGDLSPTYAGQTVAVRPYAASGAGTYSYCDQTFTLNMQLGVTNVGWFNILYQVNLAR